MFGGATVKLIQSPSELIHLVTWTQEFHCVTHLIPPVSTVQGCIRPPVDSVWFLELQFSFVVSVFVFVLWLQLWRFHPQL